MNTDLLFDFTVSKENKTIIIKREFDADPAPTASKKALQRVSKI